MRHASSARSRLSCDPGADESSRSDATPCEFRKILQRTRPRSRNHRVGHNCRYAAGEPDCVESQSVGPGAVPPLREFHHCRTWPAERDRARPEHRPGIDLPGDSTHHNGPPLPDSSSRPYDRCDSSRDKGTGSDGRCCAVVPELACAQRESSGTGSGRKRHGWTAVGTLRLVRVPYSGIARRRRESGSSTLSARMRSTRVLS